MGNVIVHHTGNTQTTQAAAVTADPLPCRLRRHKTRGNAVLAFCGYRHFTCRRCGRVVLRRWFPRQVAGQRQGGTR